MISVRLSKELEEKINLLSQQKDLTKSDIVKEALEMYIEKEEEQKKPYELGEEFFGKYGSGQGDLSTQYKKKVSEKINEKMSD
ncbi:MULTISPECIES: CopG family ribbon-helix-helix protein [unclassified Candidatus Frackibacter]|uniref:CopG family ribbon-helix-helix protein n=1 Tax=unclassified Candidatus Frackibacter TaxID=2648818 RepID=UPI0008841540|nr:MULTISPECIES: ribbon-helix-helix domain-containing protein [unclassified Candidatus Frackibacter]SDC82069.1 Ribbon-helix-helix protein, copG family [Candidatus Frackibacter sp. WG11]SEM96179.1 Ribbon-helix-helix protein, copG family [Candidatus Frackibacter sp. WG12]SFM04177.1 Ribbon-helix-helix protein, copG family [Candidatus Frackibacter sp. WG13]